MLRARCSLPLGGAVAFVARCHRATSFRGDHARVGRLTRAGDGATISIGARVSMLQASGPAIERFARGSATSRIERNMLLQCFVQNTIAAYGREGG